MEIPPGKNESVDLSVNLKHLRFRNPVLAASGTFGYGLEYTSFIDLNELGGFSTKGLSLKPRIGNPGPRMIETSSGMLNAIGLENIGIEAFIHEKVPRLANYDTRVLANFFGESVNEYVEAAQSLSEVERVDALEMNISCPNVSDGLHFGSYPDRIEEVVSRVRKVTNKLLVVKLSPNVTSISDNAKAAEAAGADALSVANTHVGMFIDIETRKPYLANKTGGLSGPAIKPIALAQVFQTSRAVDIPVIGIGGISSWQDAVEFLMAGAKLVQVGTANFIDPAATVKIVRGIRNYCEKERISKLDELNLL